jgi:hypothetical protein
LIDEPMAEFQVVTAALGRIAHGDAGPLSALEDDGNAGLAMQPSVKRFHPFVSANILGGSHHRNALLSGHGLNQGMVFLGNGLQVSPGYRLHTTTLVQQSDQHGSALPGRHDDVEDNPIKAGIDKPNLLGVMRDKAVHDGLRFHASSKHRRTSCFVRSGFQGRSPWLVSWPVIEMNQADADEEMMPYCERMRLSGHSILRETHGSQHANWGWPWAGF